MILYFHWTNEFRLNQFVQNKLNQKFVALLSIFLRQKLNHTDVLNINYEYERIQP